MNEVLEKELNEWWNEYKKEETELLNKYPLEDNKLSNNHPIYELSKKYWKRKKEIYKKYGIQ